MGAAPQSASYLDLYSKQASPARELVPLSTAETVPDPIDAPNSEQDATDTTAPPQTRFSRMTGGKSLRRLTPREMAEVSLELYARRKLTYEDYELLAFQPELHPHYNMTIGALTGEPADPDRARDYVAIWEDRLHFEERHYPQNTARVQKTERIVRLLQRLDTAVGGAGTTLAA